MTEIGGAGSLVNAHSYGAKGDMSSARTQVKSLKNSPLEAFAVLASYFAGQQNKVMEDVLTEYTDKSNVYKSVLELSETAHVLKAEAKAEEGKDGAPPKANKDFREGMDKVLQGSGKSFSDIVPKNDDGDYRVETDQAQTCIDAISQKKDILSTDLQALSTKMDMAIKDAGEAEQMAANAVKKLTDLISTQGKGSGG